MNYAKKLGVLQGLKRLCQGAVAFGFITSAAGNILHAHKDWISVPIAILAPTLFGIMFEIISRVPFRKEASLFMKIVAMLGAAGISGIMAWISYWHQRDAFSKYGDPTQAKLLPLAIDGLMVIGSVYLIELGFQIRDIEAYIAAGSVPKRGKEDQPVPTVKDKAPSKREEIARIYAAAPELAIGDIAKAAKTSYNYAHTVVRELERAQKPQPVTV